MPGSFKPIDIVEFRDLRLTSAKNKDSSFKALVGQSTAYFAEAPFSLTASVGQGTFAFSMNKDNMTMRTMVNAFFGDKVGSFAPALMMDLLSSVRFSNVTLSYDTSLPNGKELGLVATPDISQVPGLEKIMDFIQSTFGISFSTNDVMLRLTPEELLALGISKSFTMKLGSPFTEPVETTVSLDVVPGITSVGLRAQCALVSTMRLPGVQDPVGFNIMAKVTVDPELSFGLAGDTTTTIVLKGFEFIVIKQCAFATEFSVSPFMLNMLKLYGDIQIFEVPGQAFFLWDRDAGDLAFMGNVTNVDLETLIKEWGIDLDLGAHVLHALQLHVDVYKYVCCTLAILTITTVDPKNLSLTAHSGLFNMQIRQVYVAFATKPISNMGITQGMILKGDVTVFGMDSKTDIRLETKGNITFGLEFNASELNKVGV